MRERTSREAALAAVEQKLAPQMIWTNLMCGSLFITVYELLKSSIVDDVRSFFSHLHVKGRFLPGPEYKTKVLDKDPFPFRASCLWLAEVGAIKASDVDELQQIREYRNKLAHDLPRLLVDTELTFDTSMFLKAKAYADQIGRFWARTDASMNPDFDDIDVNSIPDSEIMSGRMMVIELILGAVGNLVSESGKTTSTASPDIASTP